MFSVKYELLAETFFKCAGERQYVHCEVRAEAEETVDHPP
jgi:hypothetical protein